MRHAPPAVASAQPALNSGDVLREARALIGTQHTKLATTLKVYVSLTDEAQAGAADAISAAMDQAPDQHRTSGSGAGAGNKAK